MTQKLVTTEAFVTSNIAEVTPQSVAGTQELCARWCCRRLGPDALTGPPPSKGIECHPEERVPASLTRKSSLPGLSVFPQISGSEAGSGRQETWILVSGSSLTTQASGQRQMFWQCSKSHPLS